VKSTDGHGSTWTKAFAVADDFEEADGQHVMTFHQAGDAAKALARGKADTPEDRPTTVAAALTAYKADLWHRQPNPGRGSTYRCGKSVQTIGTTSSCSWSSLCCPVSDNGRAITGRIGSHVACCERKRALRSSE
jgi:hypothetical protein